MATLFMIFPVYKKFSVVESNFPLFLRKILGKSKTERQ